MAENKDHAGIIDSMTLDNIEANFAFVKQFFTDYPISEDRRGATRGGGGGVQRDIPPMIFFLFMRFVIPFCIRMFKIKAQIAR